MNNTVKNKLIKIAYENPELRRELLALITKEAGYLSYESAMEKVKGVCQKVDWEEVGWGSMEWLNEAQTNGRSDLTHEQAMSSLSKSMTPKPIKSFIMEVLNRYGDHRANKIVKAVAEEAMGCYHDERAHGKNSYT